MFDLNAQLRKANTHAVGMSGLLGGLASTVFLAVQPSLDASIQHRLPPIQAAVVTSVLGYLAAYYGRPKPVPPG